MGDRIPVSIPPGVIRSATPSGTQGSWYEANLVRWMNGIMRPHGSIERLVLAGGPFASKCRAIKTWQDLSGIVRTAYVCDSHVYVEEGGTLRNITPVGGIIGPSTNLFQGGYGDHTYSFDTYGTPRPDRAEIKPIGPAFTVDNWGEDLLVCISTDGRLLRWQPGPTNVLVVVPNAPTGIRTFVVTPERHVIAFQLSAHGEDWGWCDQENIENWDFASITSLAGSYSIEPAAPILAARATRHGVAIWTTAGVYATRYVGIPYVYSVAEKIADAAVPLSSQAIVSYSDNVMWWAYDGFWLYDGSNVIPVSCPLLDFARRRINRTLMAYRTSAFGLGAYPELHFYYPSLDQQENDSYLSYHFFEKWWSMGYQSRSCGQPSGLIPNPLASDGVNVYLHERGVTNTYADQAILPFAKTSNMNLRKGAEMMTIVQMIPDYGTVTDAVEFDFEARNVRTGNGELGVETKNGVRIRPDGYLDVRISGRDHQVTIRQRANGAGAWSFGEFLVDIGGRGQR